MRTCRTARDGWPNGSGGWLHKRAGRSQAGLRTIHKARRIRLSDAIVRASTQVNRLLRVSRDMWAIPVIEPDVRAP